MNFGSVAIKALVVLATLYLLSLAGAITFSLLAVTTVGTVGGIVGILLFLVAIFLLSLIGNLIAKGIKGVGVKNTGQALLLAFVGAFSIGAILAAFVPLNIPYIIRVNLNWLGTSWYSPYLSLLFIGMPLMLIFFVGD